jgi:GH18 family chitinase
MVPYFNGRRNGIIAYIHALSANLSKITGFGDATQIDPTSGGSSAKDSTTTPDTDTGGSTGTDTGGTTGTDTRSPTDTDTGAQSDRVYAQLLGIDTLNQLPSSDKKIIIDTAVTQLNIGSIGGSVELVEGNNAVYIAINCPPQIPPTTMVPYFNQRRNGIIAYIHALSANLSKITGFGDATRIDPTSGGSSGTDTTSTTGTDTGGSTGTDTTSTTGTDTGGTTGTDTTSATGTDTGGSTGTETGGTTGTDTTSTTDNDTGVVYANLLGILNLDQLTDTQRQKITTTVQNRVIQLSSGSASLTESVGKVILEISCPAQIPPSVMKPRFDSQKADLLANINFPSAIPGLTGFSNAYIVAGDNNLKPDDLPLPAGPKVRFQLIGVLELKSLPNVVQDNIRSKTASITGIPKQRIGLVYTDGRVYVQIVPPDGKTVKQVGAIVKQNRSTLSTQLSALSHNIKDIGTPQATAADLGVVQEIPKVEILLPGVSSLSQLSGLEQQVKTVIANAIGLTPSSNVELKQNTASTVSAVLTPTNTLPAAIMKQALSNTLDTYIIPNLKAITNGVIAGAGNPSLSVTAKTVAITIKDLNTQREHPNTSINTAWTIGELKAKIQSLTNIQPSRQVLALGGSQIISDPDDTTLAEVGLTLNGFHLGVFDTEYEPPGWGTFTPPGQYKLVGYYAAWGVYLRQFMLSGIDVTRLTHLNYAFANIRNGEVVIGDDGADYDNFRLLNHMKSKNPHLKTLISVGGWTWSTGFSEAASTASGRATFARSAAKFMHDHNFDGIDIDWEFPVQGGNSEMKAHQKPEDKTNLTLLMQALRDEIGRDKLLTMAVTPNPHHHEYLEVAKLAQIVDWINLMAYDYNGPWPGCNQTNFNAPLFRADNDPADSEFNIHSSLHSLLNRGLPRHQLVMGLSFYGRGFANVEPGPENNGLYQTYSGKPYGTWPDEHDQGSGVYDFYDLRDNFIGKDDWQEHFSEEAEAAWLYSPSKKIFIGYDNPTTIWAKCSYIVSHGLGGGMIWDHSMDRGNQLLYTAYEVFKPDGTDISGAKNAVPQNASGTSWDDSDVSSEKISIVRFRFDDARIYGMQIVHEDGNTSNWHGSSTAGRPIEIEIPSDIGINKVVVYLSQSQVIEGIGFRYSNGTSTIVGKQNDNSNLTYYMRVPFGAMLSSFKGKEDSSGITQINCAFKTRPQNDFTRSYSHETLLQQEVRFLTKNGETSMRKLKDVYLAKEKIEIQPERLEQRAAAGRSIEIQGGMQFKIKAGSGDWLVGYGPRLETAPDSGGGYVIEYAIRSYLGSTGAVIGDEDDPAFKFSWTAPIMDYSTAYGVIVKDGGVSVTGSILGQGGTFSVGENGVAFQGTLGNVTFDTAIGSEGVKFFATTANGLFGGGLEIGPNKFAIGFTIFGFSLYLDIGAILRGEISFADIGMAILNGMLQIAWNFLKMMVKSFVALLTLGLVYIDI